MDSTVIKQVIDAAPKKRPSADNSTTEIFQATISGCTAAVELSSFEPQPYVLFGTRFHRGQREGAWIGAVVVVVVVMGGCVCVGGGLQQTDRVNKGQRSVKSV